MWRELLSGCCPVRWSIHTGDQEGGIKREAGILFLSFSIIMGTRKLVCVCVGGGVLEASRVWSLSEVYRAHSMLSDNFLPSPCMFISQDKERDQKRKKGGDWNMD